MSVVLMKPSLPAFLFDLCIIPRHDLRRKELPANVIPSTGAINRVPPPSGQPRQGGLILLGGPSSHYGWNDDATRERIRTIVEADDSRPWRVTNSRRTPVETLETLKQECPALVTYPHEATGPEWLPQRLAEAHETWVTEDSVSMIYESLSSGTRVGLLPSPRRGKPGRIIRGLELLISERWVTPYEQWKPGTALPEAPGMLREADRIAKLVLDRLTPRTSSSS